MLTLTMCTVEQPTVVELKEIDLNINYMYRRTTYR